MNKREFHLSNQDNTGKASSIPVHKIKSCCTVKRGRATVTAAPSAGAEGWAALLTAPFAGGVERAAYTAALCKYAGERASYAPAHSASIEGRASVCMPDMHSAAERAFVPEARAARTEGWAAAAAEWAVSTVAPSVCHPGRAFTGYVLLSASQKRACKGEALLHNNLARALRHPDLPRSDAAPVKYARALFAKAESRASGFTGLQWPEGMMRWKQCWYVILIQSWPP